MPDNDLQIFKNKDLGSIRTLIIENEPWFVGKDVAEILGYAKPLNAITTHVDKDDSLKQGLIDNLGRTQQTIFINESGLYSLILLSKLPSAKSFKHWITSEVLPTIRKTGGYVNNDELFINTYLPYADENTKNLFRLQLNTITQLNHKIEQDKPLVDFAEQVSSTTDLIDIGALSKLLRKQGLNIGRNKLFEWLRDNKFLRPNNEPYQQYISQGYFKTKESTYFVGSEPKITIKTFVTGKGQQYIFDKLSSATIE